VNKEIITYSHIMILYLRIDHEGHHANSEENASRNQSQRCWLKGQRFSLLCRHFLGSLTVSRTYSVRVSRTVK